MANEMGGAENLLWSCVKGTAHWYQGHAIICYFTACEETAACEIIIKCSFTRVSEFIITKSGRIVQSVNGLVSIVRARKVVIMNLQ